MTKVYTISYKGKIEINANSQDQAMDKLLKDLKPFNVTYMNIEQESESF